MTTLIKHGMKALNTPLKIGKLSILLHWSVWIWGLLAVGAALWYRDMTVGLGILGHAGAVNLAILLHELAHWAAACWCGSSSGRIVLFAVGGFVYGDEMNEAVLRSPAYKQALFYGAGCLANILLFILLFLSLKYCPYRFSRQVVERVLTVGLISLLVGMLNLCPFYILDGGKLFKLLIKTCRTPHNAGKLLEYAVYTLTGIGLLWLALWSRNPILGIIVFLIFLLMWYNLLCSSKKRTLFASLAAVAIWAGILSGQAIIKRHRTHSDVTLQTHAETENDLKHGEQP